MADDTAQPEPSRDGGSAQSPRPEDLGLAMRENWEHARHAQNLRERLNYLYWISWGAVLVFLASLAKPTGQPAAASQQPTATAAVQAGGAATDPGVLVILFTAMAVASLVVLLATLKFTVEFSNHITAVALCAELLHLNRPVQSVKARGWRSWIYAGAALPYPEFDGAMALPLKAPIFLTVGALMSMLCCLGFGLAVGFAVWQAPAAIKMHTSNTGSTATPAPGDFALGFVIGLLAWALAVLVSVFAQRSSDRNIRERAGRGG